MSGSNPFRRRDPGAEAIAQPPPSPPQRSSTHDDGGGKPGSADTDNAGTSGHHDDSPARPATRPQKTVRIASPPVPAASPPSGGSPSESTARFTTFKGQPIAHRGSPPPPPQNDSDTLERLGGAPVDPFNLEAEASGSDEESPYTGRSVDWTPKSTEDTVNSQPDRSLGAGRDHGEQMSHRRSSSNNDVTSMPPPSTEASKGKRATMDVDAFKRLLLTGEAGPGTGLGESAQAAAPSMSEGGGQAASGSKSKEEILEFYRKENYPAPALNSADESPKPVAQAGPGEKKKPPPPKTRHGKPIRSSDETAAGSSPSPSSRPSELIPSNSSTSFLQDPSGKLPQRTPSNASSATATDAQAAANPSPKPKRPPTPPLTRRHSQMKREYPGISRSSSTRSSTANAPGLSRRSSMPKAPPAPPSPRRLDRDSSGSGFAPVPSGHRRISSGQDSSAEHDSEGSSLHRSDSGSVRGASGISTRKTPGSNPPPPPPPPRRRTGGSGSLTNRTSSEDTRPNNTISTDTAISEEGMVTDANPPPSDPSQAGDVLADLSRLQKEVDDLRGQYDRRKPSR